MISPEYIGVTIIGLLHGLEPGHGWPIAVLYSTRKKTPFFSAVVSSGIIGMGHLVSSVAVVVAYVLLQRWLNFEVSWLKYVAAGLLLLLAIRLFMEKPDDLKKQHGHTHENQPEIKHEHEHEHPGQDPHTHRHEHTTTTAVNLWGIASFAFILGFAHEEEFALLALVAGGINAWILMISYSLAVLFGLVAVTVSCVKAYQTWQPKLVRFEKYVPRIGAAILVIMAITIAFW